MLAIRAEQPPWPTGSERTRAEEDDDGGEKLTASEESVRKSFTGKLQHQRDGAAALNGGAALEKGLVVRALLLSSHSC